MSIRISFKENFTIDSRKSNLDYFNYDQEFMLPINFTSFDDLIKLDNYNDITIICLNTVKLKQLPKLPDRLLCLYCEMCGLTSLPDLPNGLMFLACRHNSLEELPVLPYHLKILECQGNSLTYLPELPEGLRGLYCYGNKLTCLPSIFPKKLKTLLCYSNNIKYFPKIPKRITDANTGNDGDRSEGRKAKKARLEQMLQTNFSYFEDFLWIIF